MRFFDLASMSAIGLAFIFIKLLSSRVDLLEKREIKFDESIIENRPEGVPPEWKP